MVKSFAVILVGIALGLTMGCASLAHRPYACRSGMKYAYPMAPFYWLGGAVLQQGDCAIIDPLRIELGDYYSNHSEDIAMELNSPQTSDNYYRGPLKSFSRVFNCTDEAADQFVELMKSKRDEVFGPELEYGGRRVTKNVMNEIAMNEFLSARCK